MNTKGGARKIKGYVTYKKPIARTYAVFDMHGNKLDTVVSEVPLKASELAKEYNVDKVFLNCVNIEYDTYAMELAEFLNHSKKIN